LIEFDVGAEGFSVGISLLIIERAWF